MAGSLNVLSIHVEPSPGSEKWAFTRLLIDGRDLLADVTGYEGVDPESVLDNAVLLPSRPARRVALYGVGNGFGEGCVAPVIAEEEGVVRWRDFVDIHGFFGSRPGAMTTGQELEATTGATRLDLPDLAFDAAAYRAEVRRAVEDRSWESRPRAVARLLRHELELHKEHWGSLGVNLLQVGADEAPGRVLVQFESEHDRLINVSLPVGTDDPSRSARELARHLTTTEPGRWVATRTPRRPTRPVSYFDGSGPHGWRT